MAEHYYSENPTSGHDIKRIRFDFKGCTLEFITDAGVFSRGKIDTGSSVLLNALPDRLSGRVLDMGCGYGAIGISIAKAYQDVEVVMVDINSRAVELAQGNIKLNSINNATVYQSDGFAQVEGLFDIIVSNPPIRAGKRVVYAIFEQCAIYLKSGGEFYVVIQKKQGAESAMAKLAEIYGNCEKVARDGGYWVLRCVNSYGN
ncbi:class I SAM-dependent methyltransferase [Mahella australiensis]|uniref:16S rRNA m(2)G 1207 methyltransferase n=1 Tax=Mahella australiensis (strain DSM 15567 / CIP 107919 / 50-1 BON) TaxID=697281 RepID=F3ZYC5_MAHA5|nr:class I SAM-dependent methyltransferase [Mahella australiensis]AEE95650.1 16S rRNA m(2)G 1207 methyltransferase [Mahella australiensis 50-1 BON]